MRERALDLASSAVPASPAPAPTSRDPRLDVLRGLALTMIFVNHVPGNALEVYTTRDWGFSDAAEGFVLISGVSAGLAYGAAFRPGGDLLTGLGRVWRRAWTIYLVHLLVTVAALAVAAGLALWAGNPSLLHANQVDTYLAEPLRALVGTPLLVFHLDYADILPLYIVLLLAAPAFLWLATRAPWTLLAASIVLWAAAGQLRLNLPLWSAERTEWWFSPFSWQILFVIGVATGVTMRDGRRLVPVRGWLIALCALVVALAAATKWTPALWDALQVALARAREAGAPWVLASFHKGYETAPRLVHALALAYLLSALPGVRRLCQSRGAASFALLGRHALPVFALGSVLAFLLQGVRGEAAPHLGRDAAMLGGGLALQLALAWARDVWPAPRSRVLPPV